MEKDTLKYEVNVLLYKVMFFIFHDKVDEDRGKFLDEQTLDFKNVT